MKTDEGDRRIVFSGDIGRRESTLLGHPQVPNGADIGIMKATNGNHPLQTAASAGIELGKILADTTKRGGKTLIPAFSLGRTQDLILALHKLYVTVRRETPCELSFRRSRSRAGLSGAGAGRRSAKRDARRHG